MNRKRSIDENTWKPEQVPDDVVDPDDAEIDVIFADFPQNDTCIELFRVNAQGGRPMFLEQITPAMFSFAYVCGKYGGGKYFARGKFKNNARAPVRLPFEIEGDPFPVRRTLPAREAADPERANPVERVYAEPGEVGGDQNTALISMMRLILQRLESSEESVLRRMQIYKDLFGSNKEQAPLDTAISMFTKGLELAGNSQLGETNPWLMLAREFKDPLMKIVDTVQTAMQRPPMGSVPMPSAPGKTPSIETENKMEPEASSLIDQLIRTCLPAAVVGASNNYDVSMYVELILVHVPKRHYTALREWLLKPGCLDQLALIEPGIRFQQEWWTSLRDELLTTLKGWHDDSTTQPVENSDPPA